MTIVDDYSRQYRWRSWPTILDALPGLDGRVVLDLGCGIGDQAAELSARGANVVGIDINEEVVAYANGRHIPNAKFRHADLRTFRDPGLCVDGIWSSFAAAYFPHFRDTLFSWVEHLQPGGWLALSEIDDFFGHHPLSPHTSVLLTRYVQNALEQSRYDFLMGRKLPALIEQVGLTVVRQFAVPDAELSFSGRAAPEVYEAWRNRFDQMYLLRDFCGAEYQNVRKDFLNCLNRDNHNCTATVQCCIATNSHPSPTKADE